MCAPIWAVLFPLISSGCSTAEKIVVKPEVVRETVPATLTRDCPAKQRGPLPTTQAIVDRLVYTERALDQCSAQVRRVREWSQRQAGGEGRGK